MKVWLGHSSEHSANLVLIGRFRTAEAASETVRVLELLRDRVGKDLESSSDEEAAPWERQRFSDAMLDLLREVGFYDVAAGDLEQFTYDYSFSLNDSELIFHTDETDIIALIKLLIDREAKIEIFSEHSYSSL